MCYVMTVQSVGSPPSCMGELGVVVIYYSQTGQVADRLHGALRRSFGESTAIEGTGSLPFHRSPSAPLVPPDEERYLRRSAAARLSVRLMIHRLSSPSGHSDPSDPGSPRGSASSVVRTDDRLLLAHQGVASLPSPIALQLLDIPIVLPIQKQPSLVDGRLPDACWRTELELVSADRTRYRVRVTGDPVLGLPYGRDADVLLALFRILDEQRDAHDLTSGTFRQPSFQLICQALGLGASGPLVRRIRDALRRLSHVRIESRVLIDRSSEASRLLAQEGATAGSPTASTIRRHEVEESRWLLEYRTEERTVEERRPAPGSAVSGGTGGSDELTDRGETDEDIRPGDAGSIVQTGRTLWIHELRLNPFWVSQAISGWAGWIDVERHTGLKSITARRLYQLCAAHAARHMRLPWLFQEQELRAACLLSTANKPTRARRMLSDAADELIAAGVLTTATWQGTPRRGPMELRLEPGPLLQLSGLLRGIGLTDPPDIRVQYALLRAFGVTAAKARPMIAEKPGQVAEVLLRACHLRATEPTAVTKSWPGWIIYHVEHETSFAGEIAFQQWRRSALARLDAEAPAAAPRTVAAGKKVSASGGARSTRGERISAGEPEPRLVSTTIPAPPVNEAAGSRWSSVLQRIRPSLTILDLYGVEDAVPVDGTSDVLTLSVSDDIALKALQRLVPRIEDALRELEETEVAVRVRTHTPISGATGQRSADSDQESAAEK